MKTEVPGSAALDPGVPSLADCHLHFEGCLPVGEIARLASRAGHAFADPAAFATWAFTHKKDNGYLVSPWPYETVPRIHEALRVQEGFGDLVSRSGELSDAELQAEFRALMAGGK